MSDMGVETHTLTVCVAHYWRGRAVDGQRNPLHWVLFLISNATPESLRKSSSGEDVDGQLDHWGACYQVVGNADTLRYSWNDMDCMEIQTGGYRGCLPLANIDIDRSREVEQLMREVVVHRGREDWNGQSWVLAAVEELKASGVLPAHISSERIRSGLDEVYRRWR